MRQARCRPQPAAGSRRRAPASTTPARLGRLLAAAALLAGSAAQAASFAFEAVTVVPMDRARSLAAQTVVVTDGRITALGPAGQVDIPDGATRIDGRGRWLMPGLAEMHGHVPAAQSPMLDNVLDLFLANGITTVRGVLGEPGQLALRAALAEGRRAGPRLVTAGPSLNGQSVRNPADAVEQVEAQKAAGYDLAKLHPGLDQPRFDALMQAAERVGLPVAGHVPAAIGLDAALAAGMDSIEHMDDYVRALVPPGEPARSADPGFFGLAAALSADEARIPALVAATRRAGAAVSPTETLMVSLLGDEDIEALLARPEMQYVPAATREQWRGARGGVMQSPGWSRAAAARFLSLRRQLLKALHAGGVPVLLGSDAPQVFNVPGFSAHRELALMVDAGLTPFQALRTGTVAVAEHLGLADRRGQVAVGMDADLVLLGADPLVDIGNAARIEGVMVGGRWHDRADLDARLARVRDSVAGPEPSRPAPAGKEASAGVAE